MTQYNKAWQTAATQNGWLIPNWPAPVQINAVCTTRQGGVSAAPFDSLNLGDHVGDQPESVAHNRRHLHETLHLPETPLWLEQVHGVAVAGAIDHGHVGHNKRSSADTPPATLAVPVADAAVAFERGQVRVIMTADCLPVLCCDRKGTRIAAAHAGWRGLCDGVLEQTVAALDCDPADLMVWLGPAIGPAAFEVGAEVREAFIQQQEGAATRAAFKPGVAKGKYLADIYSLACQRLRKAGVSSFYGGDFCTVADSSRFFSYRRDGQTGRMASLIWLDE